MPDLKPMEFGEVLDGALTLFRRHFALFFKLSLVVMWLPFALLVYLRVRFSGVQGLMPDQAVVYLESEAGPLFGWGLVVVILYVGGSLLLTAGSVRIISDSYLGREPQLGPVLGFAWSKVIPLLLVGIGKSLLLILLCFVVVLVMVVSIGVGKGGGAVTGLVAFFEFCGGVWFVFFVLCGYAVTTPAVALESLPSAFDSFGRSWELTRDAKLRMFGFGFVAWFLITFLLPILVSMAVGAVVMDIFPSAELVWSAISSVIPIIIAPILPCVLTLAYYDRRVRREGFDLQLLSEQLERL